MSVRNLDSLFDPASIVVIGASERPASVGATVWRNLTGGGFTGPVYPVNHKHSHLGGHTVYARVADLPQVPELAVICTPPATVPGQVRDLAALGTRAAVILTAGLTNERDFPVPSEPLPVRVAVYGNKVPRWRGQTFHQLT